MMARSAKGSKQRPDTLMQDRTSPTRRSLLATHGRTIHLGQKQTSRPAWTLSALPPKADMRELPPYVRFVPKADSCSAKRFLRFGPKPSTSWLLAGNATSAFSQPLLSPLRSYATARCSARSSAASSPRAISETCSSSNWPNRDDGLSYSKVEPPFSFS